MTIKSYISKGNSFPVILADKEKKYFVKLHAGMSGKYALISEWIGNKLGQQLGLPTQNPTWVELDDEIEIDKIHIEVRDLIKKSLGTNIGFSYLEMAQEIGKDNLDLLDKQKRTEIFLFDLMMINIDRTSDNINLMRVEDTVYSVDYESSLLVQELIEGKKYLKNERILKCFRANPLYQEIDEKTIDEFINKLENLLIEKVLLEISNTYLTKNERVLIVQGIEERKKNNWFLKETVACLKNITTETRAERKIRMNKNQAAFKRKFKENLKE